MMLFVEHGRTAIAFPFTLNYGEGPLLDQTMRLTRGEPLYSSGLSLPPYTITNYPPVYLMLQAPFAAANGAAFWYGRAIALAATIAAALMLGVLVHALTGDWLAGGAAAISLIAVPYIFSWSALMRIDSLALALSLAGLCVIARGRGGVGSIVGCIALLTAAIYTRQTYALAAPLAAFCWLWTRHGALRAWGFAVGLGCVVLAIFIVALVATRGGFFTHVITANANALDPTLLAFYTDEIARHLPILAIGAAIGFGVGALDVIVGRPGIFLAAPYAVGALISAATIAKIGSDVNYLFEASAAACLLWGILIAAARRVAVVRAGVLAALALQLVWAVDLSVAKYDPLLTERLVKREQTAAIASFLETHDGVVLADEHMGELVISSRAIVFQPFEYSQLARDGTWDQAPFLDALISGAYPYVLIYQPYRNPLLRYERWTPEMLRIVNEYFRPEFQSGETTVYRHVGS